MFRGFVGLKNLREKYGSLLQSLFASAGVKMLIQGVWQISYPVLLVLYLDLVI